jgi:hypothetical protein
MNTMKMPGFTADASLHRLSDSDYAVGSLHSYAAQGTIHPAAAIYLDGLFLCYGDINGSGINCYGSADPGDFVNQRACARCRSSCYRLPGPRRAQCLANCNDDICP